MADGSIRVGTKIDLSGIKKGIKEIEQELARAEKEYADLEKRYNSESAKYQKRIDRGGTDGERAEAEQLMFADKMGQKMDVVYEKIQRYKQALSEATAYYQQMSEVAGASDMLDRSMADDKFVSGIQTQEQYNSLLARSRAEMARMEAHAARIAAETGQSARDILAANEGYRKASNTARLLETRTEEINANIKKSTRSLKEANQVAKKTGDSTRRGLMGFGKMQLAMMGIMFAMRAISAATQEYMAVNTELEGQINTLKALWGQVLGPVIEWVIGLLIQAVSAVNAFVHALTGINFVARANEAALKKQAKAAGGAGSKNSTASFDEQTKLSAPGGGGSDNNPVSLLNDSITSIPEKLRELIQAGDWYGAGKFIGNALMDGIDSVDWKGIGTKVGKVLGDAAAFVLGFVLSIDPITLLAAAAELATGRMDGLSKAIQNIDWMEVGSDIVDFLMKALVVSLITTNPFVTLIALIFTPQGTELAKSAAELAGSIAGALAAAIVGAAKRLGEIGTLIWDTIKTYFDGYVDWEGTPEDIIVGLFNGIVDALKNIGTWIYENIWVPFRDGFKEAFGIHSPSTKMREFGVNIIEGLVKGIKDFISRVVSTCKELWNKIKEVFASVGGWFKEKFTTAGSNIASGFTGALSKIKSACSTIWSTIKGVFSGVADWFKNTFSTAWTAVKNVFSSGGKIFDGIKDGIASTFKTIVNGLISGINKIISVPFNAINGMLNTIRGISVLGVSPFKGLWKYNPLSIPQIPKLALGGIVNRPGRGVPAIIGEAGAEAVLPLENNTEWMDILADKISGGNVTIPIYLDGKKLYTYVVDIGKRRAFALNGG